MIPFFWADIFVKSYICRWNTKQKWSIEILNQRTGKGERIALNQVPVSQTHSVSLYEKMSESSRFLLLQPLQTHRTGCRKVELVDFESGKRERKIYHPLNFHNTNIQNSYSSEREWDGNVKSTDSEGGQVFLPNLTFTAGYIFFTLTILVESCSHHCVTTTVYQNTEWQWT